MRRIALPLTARRDAAVLGASPGGYPLEYDRMPPQDRTPYCDAHVELVGALERCGAILDRAAGATDALIDKVHVLAERIARLETRLSLYAVLFASGAAAAGWILGAMVAHWLGNR